MRHLTRIFLILCAPLVCANALAAAPQRLVSLKPTITDVVVALGMGERLVGVTRYCDIPPSPSPLPQGERENSAPSPLRGEGGVRGGPAIVGDYTQPSAERIIALAPDVVLGSKENSSRRSIEQLQRMGVRVELFPFSTIAETLSSIRGIARLLGAEEQGERIARGMERELAALKKRWGPSPAIRTVVAWGVRPLIVAGPSTYMDELLQYIGAKNAVSGTKIAYPRIGLEELIALDPDAIVDLSMGSERSEVPPHPDPLPSGEREKSVPDPLPSGEREKSVPGPLPSGERDKSAPSPWPSSQWGGGKERKPWDGIAQIRAVREGRVITLDASLFRAGPRLPSSLAKLAEMIHKP